MKAHVDRRGCIACGLCVVTCPEVFQFEDGLSSVIVDERKQKKIVLFP